LVIYATPQGRTVRLKETQDPKAFGSQPINLPFQQSTPLDPPSCKQDQEIQDLCREQISTVHGHPSAQLSLAQARVIDWVILDQS